MHSFPLVLATKKDEQELARKICAAEIVKELKTNPKYGYFEPEGRYTSQRAGEYETVAGILSDGFYYDVAPKWMRVWDPGQERLREILDIGRENERRKGACKRAGM